MSQLELTKKRFSKIRKVVFVLCIAWGWIAAAQNVPPPSPSAIAPALDALTNAATSLGVKRCLPYITKLSAQAVAGSSGNDVLVDWDRQNPDGGPFFALSSVAYQNGSVALSLTAVPNNAGGCAMAAERISTAPFTCQSIAQQELQGYQITKLLPTFTVYVDPRDPGASVSMIDSPPGCLIIRRNVQYALGNDPAPLPAKTQTTTPPKSPKAAKN